MQHQSNIDQFHTYLNTVLSELLENQIKTRSFITGVQQYKNQVVENSPIEFDDLYLYYMGEFPAKARDEAKKKLWTPIVSKLCRTKDLKIKEYQVLNN
jgi:hypothetical protein